LLESREREAKEQTKKIGDRSVKRVGESWDSRGKSMSRKDERCGVHGRQEGGKREA
jgi:hypothetical protein